jgi:hypothetical protein
MRESPTKLGPLSPNPLPARSARGERGSGRWARHLSMPCACAQGRAGPAKSTFSAAWSPLRQEGLAQPNVSLGPLSAFKQPGVGGQ